MLTLLFISLRIHFTFEIFRHMLSFFFIFSKKKRSLLFLCSNTIDNHLNGFLFFFFNPKKENFQYNY